MADSHKKQLDEAKAAIKRHAQRLERHRKIRTLLMVELVLAFSLVASTAAWVIHAGSDTADYTGIWSSQAIVLSLICVCIIIRRRIQRKDIS